jgi:hypothetical protein
MGQKAFHLAGHPLPAMIFFDYTPERQYDLIAAA